MTPEKKNILFIITSLYGGGSEKVCCLLASALSERYNVTIGYMEEKEESYPVDEKCEVVKLYWEPYYGRDPVKKVVRALKGASFCRKLKRDRNIDAAVSFLLPANQLNILSKGRERVVTSERANPKKYLPRKFTRTKMIYSLSDHVVFQSEAVRGLFGSRIKNKSSIILNPVSVTCTAEDVRNKRIVNIGRLDAQKNQKMLIRSFNAFSAEYPEYTLSIYGEGEMRDELLGLIRELGAEDRILLEGNVRDVHERIRDAEMFVLSSDYEGLSNALLECMAMGIACISTDCEGSKDIIRDGENGLLSAVGSEEGLTKAMKRLAADPFLRRKIERQAAEDIRELSVERIAGEWEKILF